MTSKELAERAQRQLASRQRVNEYLATQVQRLPEAEDDVMERILEQIATVESLDDIDAAWNSTGFGDFVDYVLTLHAAKRLPSDKKDGCGWFIVVDATIKATGRPVAVTTSSSAIMRQVVQIHDKGWFPVDMIPRLADRPTADGNYPMHLELYRGGPLEPAARGKGHQLNREAMDRINAKRSGGAPAAPAPADPVEDAVTVDDTQEVPY